MKLLQKYWWVLGLLLAVGLAILSPLASPHPDGLERVAEEQGFMSQARSAPFELVADYLIPGIENEALATMLAGVMGTVILFGLGAGLAWILRRRQARGASKGGDAA
jgi:predicted outer membrane lipoprotein